MPIYASTFTSGLEPLVKECFPRLLRGSQIYDIYNGLIVYRFEGKPEQLARPGIFANTYLVLARQNSPTFRSMVLQAGKAEPIYMSRVRAGQSFRVRFQRNGRLEHVDPALHAQAEQLISRRARLRVDRENPDWEFWYIIRSENIGLYCMLVNRREQTERDLPRGALRPELARCMCVYAGVGPRDTVLDPFAGHGSIPMQLFAMHRGIRVLAGDIDEAAVRKLRRALAEHVQRGAAQLERWDARHMNALPDNSMDRVITDPPWGVYDAERYPDIATFYLDALTEIARVLRPGGTLVMLSAAKSELMRAARQVGLLPEGRLDILVNGKKAALMRFRKPKARREQF